MRLYLVGKVKTFFGVGSLNSRDPTPKKVLYAKSGPMSDRSWQGVKTSSGLDPWISRDPTPEKVLYAKSAPMSDRSWRGSRLSSGLDTS